ncbi:MAG: PTPDL family protein [Luteolibacter sp.]
MKSTLLTVAALLLCQAAGADTITLKSGESMEGSILREDAENYYIQVNVTESIKEEKVVAKADVKSVEKVSEEEKAFAKISELTPAPDLLEEEGYTARIERIEAFLEAYPSGSKKKSAEDMIAELKGELEVIAAGGAKMEGLMISPEEYEANAYALDEQIAAQRISDAIGRRDFLSSLRRFEDYETCFSQAAGRPIVVNQINQVLAAFGASLRESLATFDQRMERRETGLERMSQEDRTQTKKALDERYAQLNAKFEEEKAAKEKWITPDINHKQSLTEALRQVDATMKKLDSAKVIATEKPLEDVYRDTWTALGDADEEAAQTAIMEARRAKLPDIYLEKLTERAGIAPN